MGLEIQTGGAGITVTLSGATDIAALGPLMSGLLAASSEGKSVVVNLDGVTGLDAAAVGRLLDTIQLVSPRVRLVVRQPLLPGAIDGRDGHPKFTYLRFDVARGATAPAGSDPTGSRGARHAFVPRSNEPACAEIASPRGDLTQLEAQYRHAIQRCREFLARGPEDTDL